MPVHQIVTHPGSAHKDDFLACSVLVSAHGAPVLRRDVAEPDLLDPEIAVVDVGGRHQPELQNFDHHQFPREHDPACALSLVLQAFGVYDDARCFCEWMETAEWFDSRGPVETARWLGVERGVLNQLNSPIDITLLRRFAQAERLGEGDALWEVMRMLGDDLLGYLRQLRSRIDFIAENAERWDIPLGDGQSFAAVFLPRTEPLPSEPAMGLPRYIDQEGVPALAMVYPDRRGGGYGLSRFRDCRKLDFTRLEDEPDTVFAHLRGFLAKTEATDPDRLKELLARAYVAA